MNIAYLSMDVEQPPFDDVHVRRAMAYALDAAGVTHAFLGPAGAPATTLVPPAQWGDVLAPDRVRELYASLPAHPFDLDRARAELASSRHPDGFEAHVQFATDHPALGKALVSLSESLKRIGIRLTVKGVPASAWIAGIYAHDQPLVAASLGPDYPDPANYLTLLLPSANATKNNFNSANFKDPAVDRLLERQAASTDPAERARLIGEVLRTTGEQLPYLPIWWQSAATAVADAYVLNDLSPLWYFGDWAAGLAHRG
jgi:peptide/nickel transport system substrate-binding protein